MRAAATTRTPCRVAMAGTSPRSARMRRSKRSTRMAACSACMRCDATWTTFSQRADAPSRAPRARSRLPATARCGKCCGAAGPFGVAVALGEEVLAIAGLDLRLAEQARLTQAEAQTRVGATEGLERSWNMRSSASAAWRPSWRLACWVGSAHLPVVRPSRRGAFVLRRRARKRTRDQPSAARSADAWQPRNRVA